MTTTTATATAPATATATATTKATATAIATAAAASTAETTISRISKSLYLVEYLYAGQIMTVKHSQNLTFSADVANN